jgi:5-formyltetrahydrofolate cyclo-ligase
LPNDLTQADVIQNADRQQLRQQLRAGRRALTQAQQLSAARHAADNLCLFHGFRKAKHVALYIANDGELDPHLLAKRAVALGKTCYLPVLDPRRPAMTFARWQPGDKLIRNRFGIPEPLPQAPRLSPEKLDLVCLPLVGFDDQGNRLGMGGGFYDRTFAYRHTYPKSKPLLVGMAHACQQVPSLPVQPWDVPLDMILTDERRYMTSRNRF